MRSLRHMMSLSGRVAVVTGGAGHLGSAICRSLAELGAGVAVLDLPGHGQETLSAELRRQGEVPTCALNADLEGITAQRARSICDDVIQQLGRLDILVNCAAFVGPSDADRWTVPFEEQDVGKWRPTLDINLAGVFTLTQACSPSLRESEHGSVVNIASIYALVGPQPALYEGTTMGNSAAYAASKGGLVQLTRWLATTLAPDVRVNAVSPGGILRGDQHPVFQERYASRVPLGRMGVEEDVVGAVAYLASDLSSYVTGQNLVVDGGWTAW